MSTATTAGLHGETITLPAWKSVVSHIAAAITALLFLAAGLFKMAMPYQVQQLFEQLLVPAQVSLALVLTLSVLETLAGVLVLIPTYRRYGGILASLLLVAFMIYIGGRYNELVGRDCSCFPWVKRAVGPAFFWEDGAMLVAALAAAFFSVRPPSLRVPAAVFAGLIVFSGASFGYNTMHQSGIQVPPTITVDGKPYNLRQGHIFLFFYDPQCSHCEDASRRMATYKWKSDVTVIGFPTNMPQWAESFLHDTKFTMVKTSNDTAELRKLFVFTSPPYGVALDNGRVKGIVSHYDPPQPEAELRELGLLE